VFLFGCATFLHVQCLQSITKYKAGSLHARKFPIKQSEQSSRKCTRMVGGLSKTILTTFTASLLHFSVTSIAWADCCRTIKHLRSMANVTIRPACRTSRTQQSAIRCVQTLVTRPRVRAGARAKDNDPFFVGFPHDLFCEKSLHFSNLTCKPCPIHANASRMTRNGIHKISIEKTINRSL